MLYLATAIYYSQPIYNQTDMALHKPRDHMCLNSCFLLGSQPIMAPDRLPDNHTMIGFTKKVNHNMKKFWT